MTSTDVAPRVSDDDLLDMIRAAEAPSRDIDYAVTLWLGSPVDDAAWLRVNPQDINGWPWHRLERSTIDGTPLPDGRAHVVAAWSSSLDAVVGLVRHVLPDWWWSIGVCSVSADSTLGPDRQGVDATLLELPDRRFDEAFSLDVRDGHPCLSTIENLVLARMARDEVTGTTDRT